MAMRLETSTGRGIDHYQGSEISQYNINWAKDLTKKFPNAKIRTDPSPLYNCHGLTFACRRTSIDKNRYITTILKDDKYDEVADLNVLPGDIVIYYSEQGDPNHSGVVVDTSLVVPIICSKWGNAGEFVHSVYDCPTTYGPRHKYYRCKL
jgi:hypothetical protein